MSETELWILRIAVGFFLLFVLVFIVGGGIAHHFSEHMDHKGKFTKPDEPQDEK